MLVLHIVLMFFVLNNYVSHNSSHPKIFKLVNNLSGEPKYYVCSKQYRDACNFVLNPVIHKFDTILINSSVVFIKNLDFEGGRDSASTCIGNGSYNTRKHLGTSHLSRQRLVCAALRPTKPQGPTETLFARQSRHVQRLYRGGQ